MTWKLSLLRTLTLLLLATALPSFAVPSINKVEPPSWWAGMNSPDLQLMIHGTELHTLTPKINYPGIKIISIDKTDNPNYLFINLSLSKSVKPGSFTLQLLDGKKEVVSYSYTLAKREPASAERKGFSNKDAMLLITPDRFVNGDPTNDVVVGLKEGSVNRADKGARHGGDIKGMIQALDYIQAMGFTQIWPNPLLENDMPAYSYHGYAATDLYKIDPRYGSNEDFKVFVDEARKRGIGVVKDIILNHIGVEHWWMKDLPAKDWVNFTDNYTETNHRRTTLQDPYAAKVDSEQFVGGWFSRGMPDLNQQHPLLRTYLIQHSIWWTEYAGLSGIREDTYGYADHTFLTHWAKALFKEYPHFSIVGEEWSNNPAIVAQWQRGSVNKNGHQPFTNSMMDFPIYEAVRTGLLEDEGWDKGLILMYEALANDFIYPDPYSLVTFPENHDTSRIYSYLNEDLDLFKSALIYYATMRGLPQFYYGSEVLMTSPRERDDGAVRADMPGGFAGDKVNAFTGEGLTKNQQETQQFFKALLNYRKQTPALHNGKLIHFSPEHSTYVYFRYDDKKTVMVIINKNQDAYDLPLNRFVEVIGRQDTAKNILTGQSVDLSKALTLPPRTSIILEWSNQ